MISCRTISCVLAVLHYGGFGFESLAEDFDHAKLQMQLRAAIRKVLPTTVGITERRGDGFGSFSGVIVTAEGHILSAAHTVRPDANYEVHLTDGRHFQAKGLGVCGEADFGMLKITEADSLPVASMGDSSTLVVNQPCFGISHPGTYQRQRGGVVRFGRVVRPISPRLGMIHTTAMMEPGDSGGPLFDLEGHVIGIHSQIQQPLAENFDVPVNSYKLFWDQLNKPQRFEVSRIPGLPALGFSGRRSPRNNGVRIIEVNEGGAAELAGLQFDDLVTGIDGSDITSSRALNSQIVTRFLEGERVFNLEIQREDKFKSISLKLTEPVESEPSSLVVAGGLRPIAAVSVKGLENLPSRFSDLEARLDDVAVKIVSQRDGHSESVLATRIEGSHFAISKSSRVFDNPKIILHDSTVSEARVLARDDSNDLVLLHGTSRNTVGINLNAGLPTISSDDLGVLLISPDPNGSGQVSVLGSRTFDSPRVESRGYLGVTLDTVDNRVLITDVLRRGAASRVGILEGDIITSVDELQVSKHQDVRGYLSRQLPDSEVTVVIERDGERLEKIAKLESPPAPRHVADRFDGGKSLRRDGFTQVFCHDGTIDPSQCGGPVFDTSGRFLGINIARHSRTLSYVVAPSVLRRFVEEMAPK